MNTCSDSHQKPCPCAIHVSTQILKALHEPQHDPFVSRKILGFVSAFPAIALGVFFEDFFWGAAFYFVCVTLGDLLSHHVLKISPSRGSNAELLLLLQKVTPEQFDAYFDTRRWIRVLSLISGLAFGILAFCCSSDLWPEIFCGVYMATTWAGIFWVRFSLKIPRPRLCYRDDRYYIPPRPPRPGCITLAQMVAAKSAGISYGAVDPLGV